MKPALNPDSIQNESITSSFIVRDSRLPGSYQKTLRANLALCGVPPIFEKNIFAAYDIAKYAHLNQIRDGGGALHTTSSGSTINYRWRVWMHPT